MEQSQSLNKVQGVAIAGTASAASIGTAVTMLCLCGPAGIIAAGVVLGAGIAGGFSTTQQAMSKENEFDYKKWGVQSGIGAVGGAIGAPFAVATTTLAASGVGVTVGTQLAADVASQMASSACCKMLTNKVNQKELGDGLLTSTIIGGIAGGVLSGVDLEITDTVSSTTSNEITFLVVDVTTDAVLNGGSRQIIDDLLTKKTINKDLFILYLQQNGAQPEIAEKVWEYLVQNDYIVDGAFTDKFQGGLDFPKELVQYENAVLKLYQASIELKLKIEQQNDQEGERLSLYCNQYELQCNNDHLKSKKNIFNKRTKKISKFESFNEKELNLSEQSTQMSENGSTSFKSDSIILDDQQSDLSFVSQRDTYVPRSTKNIFRKLRC